MHQRWIAFVTVIGLATAVFAAPQKTAPRGGEPIEGRTISLDYKMGEIQTVFKDIAHQVGADLQADTGIGGKVSLTMQNAQFSRVMDTICQNFHCTWKVQKGNRPKLVIASQPVPAH
jgi:hypothetical protein